MSGTTGSCWWFFCIGEDSKVGSAKCELCQGVGPVQMGGGMREQGYAQSRWVAGSWHGEGGYVVGCVLARVGGGTGVGTRGKGMGDGGC